MAQGKINVHAENIFPIIKKFLYSDHEIFLRELVSNGVDACQKLKTLASLGEAKGDIGDLLVEVKVDEKKGTVTISDTGIGMTEEEVVKYIADIAFSGAEEFVQKYKDQAKGIIGHFGLGFFSAFMVSDKVEVISRSYQGGDAVKWTCEGSPDYTIEKAKKKSRGTDIILHISEDSKEFLQEGKITELLNKYCKFLPIEIRFGTKEEKEGEGDDAKTKTVPNVINNTDPAWTKAPADLKEDDYKDFYRELYPMTFEDPLFNIHLNVDYPFTLTGILYFPKLRGKLELQRNKIQLYCNQVFVTDSVEGIVPEFLTLLHGVIDSPDIPLNVSRSYLQSDHNVKKISNHITKKVADKLEELYKQDKEDYQKKWDDIQIFIEYGMLTEEKFYDRSEKFYLLKNAEGEFFTLDEYQQKVGETQKDKDGNIVYLYAADEKAQHSYIEAAREKGYDVLIMNSPTTSHLIGKLEQKLEKTSFKRVDADTIDKLIQKEEDIPSKLTEDQQNQLKPLIEEVVEKDKFSVQFESLSESDAPITVTEPEFMRRMKEMNELGGGSMYGSNLPENYNLVVNANHPLIGRILVESDDKKRKGMIKQAADLALLSRNMLQGKDLTEFIKRSLNIIE